MISEIKPCVSNRVIGPSQKLSLNMKKLKFYDLLNGSMESVFQKIQKWDM